MTEILTESGTVYQFHNGRMTRYSFGEDYIGDISHWPCFRHLAKVEVGEGMSMKIHGLGSMYTSPVVNVIYREKGLCKSREKGLCI